MFFLLIGEATGCAQLVKLPKLYEHFVEHFKLNPSLSLVEFLSMHYWGDDLNDDDDEKDMALPFKKQDISAPVFLLIPNQRIVTLKPRIGFIKKNFNPAPTQFYFNPAGESLFRPPRMLA
jgi:hypothetical protein